MKMFTHIIPYNRFHEQFRFDLHILSYENSLFYKTIRKDLIRSWIFRYFSFTFYIQFILFAGKEALEIKRIYSHSRILVLS